LTTDEANRRNASRVELPPGARPFVPQRDLLVGEASLQRRHLLARTALLRRLLIEPRVQQAFDDWETRHGFHAPLETLTIRLDRLASDVGLSSRTDLFAPESTLDAATKTARREAFEAFWSGVNGNAVELIRAGHRLAQQLLTALGLSAVCIPWLTWELLSWFFDSIAARIKHHAVTRRYTEKPCPEVVTVRIDPRMSARRQPLDSREQGDQQRAAVNAVTVETRMPSGDWRYIDGYVGWLLQQRLHGVSVRALARVRLRDERDVPRSATYDARHRVQYGIRQARTWLAAVAHTPSSRPSAETRTTRQRSTRRRRKRSPPG
jgi:hypothetical protein